MTERSSGVRFLCPRPSCCVANRGPCGRDDCVLPEDRNPPAPPSPPSDKAMIVALRHELRNAREELNLKDEALAVVVEDRDRQHAEIQRLREAAQAVVDEFGWSESCGYGMLIGALRAALEKHR